jgi:hypothetical protein
MGIYCSIQKVCFSRRKCITENFEGEKLLHKIGGAHHLTAVHLDVSCKFHDGEMKMAAAFGNCRYVGPNQFSYQVVG